MDYAIFRKTLSKEEFFGKWTRDDFASASDADKEKGYNDYVVKSIVFQRDGFKCQNVNCEHPHSGLTLHHIKHQRNGGKTTVRNCITICLRCHELFNKKAIGLTFADRPELPAHVRNRTFKINKDNSINWKQVRAEGKKIRKQNKEHHGYRISWEMMLKLIRFLKL